MEKSGNQPLPVIYQPVSTGGACKTIGLDFIRYWEEKESDAYPSGVPNTEKDMNNQCVAVCRDFFGNALLTKTVKAIGVVDHLHVEFSNPECRTFGLVCFTQFAPGQKEAGGPFWPIECSATSCTDTPEDWPLGGIFDQGGFRTEVSCDGKIVSKQKAPWGRRLFYSKAPAAPFGILPIYKN
ncbi:hypothetical protein WDW37_05330 [Bdellovibrionota bacterium FG-1]